MSFPLLSRPAPELTQGGTRARYALHVLLAVLGISSLLLTKLSLFVLVGSFLAYVALKNAAPRILIVLCCVAFGSSLVGFMRFLIVEAMPGIVQGGTSATGNAAVSRLREILFAQDTLRRSAKVDPDGDGVGSAALLGELLGTIGLRGGAPLTPPVLERYPELVETALGPAAEIAGHFVIICLPAANGGWTARPGEAVDEEAAERRFVAYAWPSSDGRGLLDSYFIDQDERILFARSGAPLGLRKRTGPLRPPRCDDALAAESRDQWQVWRGKQPRPTLPGDR